MDIVAVTVLTSFDGKDLDAVGAGADVPAQSERLGRLAWDAGVRAFVCSPHEASRLRAALGAGATIVTPGVRAADAANKDDQKRTMTAGEAVAAGADWLVVGRPIRDAADPAAAARRIAGEIAAARASRRQA